MQRRCRKVVMENNMDRHWTGSPHHGFAAAAPRRLASVCIRSALVGRTRRRPGAHDKRRKHGGAQVRTCSPPHAEVCRWKSEAV